MSEGEARLLCLVAEDRDFGKSVAEAFTFLAGERESLTLALSADAVLTPVLDALCAEPVDWQKVQIFFTHEKCVNPDQPGSQFGETRERFLKKIALPEGNVHRIPAEISDHEEAIARYKTTLDRHSDGRLDLVLLGLGPLGEVAFLYPDSPALVDDGRLLRAVRSSAEGPRWITLTAKAISLARNVWVVVRGAEMAQPAHDLLEGDYDSQSNPIHALRLVDGQMVWFVEAPAAMRLAVASRETRGQ